MIAEALQLKGFRFVTMSELVGMGEGLGADDVPRVVGATHGAGRAAKRAQATMSPALVCSLPYPCGR